MRGLGALLKADMCWQHREIADQSDRAQAGAWYDELGHRSRCRASYSEDLNPVTSRDLPLCSGSCDSSLEQAGFEPSVPLPRARLVAVRRPYYSECIKLSYRVRPVHLDFSQNPALLTSCQ